MQSEIHLGRDDEPDGLRRTWAGLRRRLHRPRPRTEREEVERTQQLRVRGNQATDDVSYTNDAQFE